MRVEVAILIAVLALSGVVYSQECERLERAVVLARHGARTPFPTLPEDLQVEWNCSVSTLMLPSTGHGEFEAFPGMLFRKTYVPGTSGMKGNCFPGQLTAEGLNQHSTIGAELRSRYIDEFHLLDRDYDPSAFYLRATDAERTLLSLQAMFLGLFPPRCRSCEAPTPVIHTILAANDILNPSTSCPAMVAQCNAVQQTPAWKARLAAMAPVGETLRAAWGVETLPLWNEIYDTLIARRVHGLPMPPGVTETVFQNISTLVGHQIHDIYAAQETVSLGLGPFILDLEGLLSGTAPSVAPLSIFLAHDTTVAQLLSALGISSVEWPPFAAHLIMEVWHNSCTGVRSVAFRYNGSPATAFCGASNCSLPAVLDRLHPYAQSPSINREMCANSNATPINDLSKFLC